MRGVGRTRVSGFNASAQRGDAVVELDWKVERVLIAPVEDLVNLLFNLAPLPILNGRISILPSQRLDRSPYTPFYPLTYGIT